MPSSSNHTSASFGWHHPNYLRRNLHHHLDRPPSPSPSPSPSLLPNFLLRLNPHPFLRLHSLSLRNLLSLLRSHNCSHDSLSSSSSSSSAFTLAFTQWSFAFRAYTLLWKSLLSGSHNLIPTLTRNVIVHSDVDELNSTLRPLFSDYLRLMSVELVGKWDGKVREVEEEIDLLSASLRRRGGLSLRNFGLVNDKIRVLRGQKEFIQKRIVEFKSVVDFLIRHVEGGGDEGGGAEVLIKVVRFHDGVLNWSRIYCLMVRECRRFEDDLPIYAFRRKILSHIASQQVMVLVGETGSGKSTQLVQFLADSGEMSHGCVICTQPRKIAASSLAQRVQEESHGCYENDAIGFQKSYFSALQFEGKVLYMTDHCLLQHCMNDRNLHGVSCILVDEAHERSLNSDLLLAVLKNLLPHRPDLRLIIMSATANMKQLSEYFYGCRVFTVLGRKFPIDIKYMPCLSDATPLKMTSSGNVACYMYDICRVVTDIHKTEEEGTILVFLTSLLEVEWACEKFQVLDAEPLALHGMLSYEEECRVFFDYPGKRKIIFATNVAEASLTIPGIKYVVDSGMAKEKRFDPRSGMNVLRVCRISKSSANQRAGRAGRTEAGRCYRLYSQDDYHSMADQHEPEILRVHVGVAVLNIVALGMKNIKEFDFLDAPSPEAINLAIHNLVQLGAVTLKDGDIELTGEGRYLVKLGIEPRLGKIVLSCFSKRLGKEGLVLASVMADHKNIFCRVGNYSDKHKSDCLKVPFCHPSGDLFTLLSVYRAWEDVPVKMRKRWCWENSINAKSMQRCQDAILELEKCLEIELKMSVPSYWCWMPDVATEHDKNLKLAILSSLAENVSMFTGRGHMGYEVALTGQCFQLHPACSLLMFNQRPDWVVFGEIFSSTNQYMVCVTAFDREFLSTLSPPQFDISKLEGRKLEVRKFNGYGKVLLKRFCGKSKNSLLCLESQIRRICGDARIGIEVDVDSNEIQIFSSSDDLEKVLNHVNEALDLERGLMQNECMERSLCPVPGVSSAVALFGCGAEIKNLVADSKHLTIDVYHPNVCAVNDKELTFFFERHAAGICAVHKSTAQSPQKEEIEKWGSITFLTPDAAERATELNNIVFDGSVLRVKLSEASFGIDRAIPFPALKARLFWPRRCSKGVSFVKCEVRDVDLMLMHFGSLQIRGKYVHCEASQKYPGTVVISKIDTEASEPEILHALGSLTNIQMLDFLLVRGDAVDDCPCRSYEEALLKEITALMSKGSPQLNFCRVQVFQPMPQDYFFRALITFDGRLHLEAAKALEEIEGKPLSGFRSWQRIQCRRLFHSSLACPSSVYFVIKRELDSLVVRSHGQKGTECILTRNMNGTVQVKITATATKVVAELRRSFEALMKGKAIIHDSLTPAVLELLYLREGSAFLQSIQREIGVYMLFDRRNLKVTIFGPTDKICMAEERLIENLVSLHEHKQLEIHLRGAELPNDLMKEVVKRFGPDLHKLKEKVPEADFTLNTRRHVIYICGSNESKHKAEEIINEISQANRKSTEGTDGGHVCGVCFCAVEDDCYELESCMHVFCRSCLVMQCESAINSHGRIPVVCAVEGCKAPLWLADLKCLLPLEKLDELFNTSVQVFVESSCGNYRFCPSAGCVSVYRVASTDNPAELYICGICYAETCTKCHLEHHPFFTCEMYKEFKSDPDSSLKEWCKRKGGQVKKCPACGFVIEKIEGCNHVVCNCGKHICWVCLEGFQSSDDCYGHLRKIHNGLYDRVEP